MTLIPREPGALESLGHPEQEGALLDGVPERDGVAAAAELEAQHARDAVERHVLDVRPRAEIVDLLQRGEEVPHPPAGRDEALGVPDQVEQDADGGGIVIGARAARDRVVMGAKDEDAIARSDLDGVGLAVSFVAREGMPAERDAAVLEVAGHGGLAARRVAAD